MPKNETEAMSAAFDALKGQTPEIENRMLVWLHHRLRENRRGREAIAYKGPEPIQWQFIYEAGEEVGTYDTRDESRGIVDFMKQVNDAGIAFKDLRTRQSSLEEIFVSLVEGGRQ